MDEKMLNIKIDMLFSMLMESDKEGRRREMMNALLRMVAMIIYESEDPERSKEVAFTVIESALQEKDGDILQ